MPSIFPYRSGSPWPFLRFFGFVAPILLALGCVPASAQSTADAAAKLKLLGRWTGDFDGMQKRRLIRIIVPYSKTIYFLDKGEQFGTAFEGGEELGDWLNSGKKAEIEKIRIAFVPTPREKLLAALNDGLGDIVAANLTVTANRQATVDFTKPIMTDVHEILVTGPSAPTLDKIEELGGRDLYVRKSSSYYDHLVALNGAFAAKGLKPVKLVAADENLEDEDLLEMVNAAILPYVVVDDHKAAIWAKVFPRLKLRSELTVNDDGAIAWAIRTNSPVLKAKLDAFVDKIRVDTDFGSWLKKRYYGDDKMVRRAYAPQDIARFNELVGFFRRYGDQYGFDHLMVTAQGYQESRLNQADRSKSGAVGVMQLLPSTARDPAIAIAGIDKSAERNIEAGNKYLRYLITKYINDPTLDAQNQTLFAFAAYNAGPGNLKKFRAKAEEMGLNPNIWFGNVENAAAAIIGRETVQYVSNIYKYYVAYSLLAHEVANTEQARKTMLPDK